jgi:hypothetical protein
MVSGIQGASISEVSSAKGKKSRKSGIAIKPTFYTLTCYSLCAWIASLLVVVL